MWSVWLKVRPFLGRRGRLGAGALSLLSLAAGLLEALLLVLVVTSALTVAEGDDVTSFGLPVFGTVEVSTGVALAAAALAGLAVVVLHVVVSRLTAMVAGAVLAAARRRLIRAFAESTWERQDQEREGALQEAATTLAGQTAQLVLNIASFVAAVLGLGALLAAALVVDPLATLAVLLFGAVLLAILTPLRRLTHSRGRRFVERNSALAERISQWGSLAMEHRVFGVDEVQAKGLESANRGVREAFVDSRFVTRLGTHLFRDLAVLMLVGAVVVLHVGGDIDLAAVGSVVILIVRSLAYAQGAQGSAQAAGQLAPNLDRLLDRIQSLEQSPVAFGDTVRDSFGRIELNDVVYAYEPDRPAVEGVSLTLEVGEAVGIIGPSGGGKSTLVQILLRLRPPVRGSVTVDGLDYREISSGSWSRLVALAPQEPKLFEGTVADNIGFFREGIDRERVERAAADAHVGDDIERLPQGFDTMLGPRGVGLSGGQKQRIAIARALAGDPQLLVLDEPTSALDVRSERLLQQTISSLHGRVTLVIVAHRVSTLTICDRVVAMADGRVVTIGSLDEALAAVSFDTDLVEPTPAGPHG
ncbi:MAG: ABC transporter ATP-binding protein [Acidimicrobiales bacterium]|nr:ABC transporter ATP-binding protein [Acidimicrobiales bacterium]